VRVAQQGDPAVLDVENWSSIKTALPDGWERIADDNGLGPSARDSHNASKVRAESRLHTLLTMVAWNLSLRAVSGLFAAAGIHRVTHVGIHGWLRRSVATFEEFLRLMISSDAAFAAQRWAGYLVRAIDATTAQRPGATGITARIHIALCLWNMRLDQVKVTGVSAGETLRLFETRPGVLDIVDRGYCNPPSIAAAVDQGGDVLVRWNPGSLPLSRAGGVVDVHEVTGGLTPGQRRELSVTMPRRNGSPIPGRLVIERLPNDQAERARQRVRAEGGGRTALEQAPFVMLVTTVPADRLSAAQLLRLYRLRWQVELQFKRDKSITGLDLLPNFREDTIRAWLLAKLVLGQIARRLLDRESPQPHPPGRSQARPSMPVSMPWQATVTGWMLLRIGLLTFRLRHAAVVVRRLHDQLARLRMDGKKAGGQIPKFLTDLAALTPAAAA
jgi:hypothetical protein